MFEDSIEFRGTVKADYKLSGTLFPGPDFDLCAQLFADLVLQPLDVRIRCLRFDFYNVGGGQRSFNQQFGFPHRQATIDDQLGNFDLIVANERQQRTRMTHVEQALVDLLFNRFGKIEQAQQVADGSARTPHRIRNLLMRKVKFFDQT